LSAAVAFDRIEQIQAMMASLAPVGAKATPSSPSTSPTAFASSLQAATGAAAPTATAGTTATSGAATPFAAEIDAAAARNGVDPALLRGLIRQESNFNADARSPAGAMGLTQLMPATAAGLGVTNPSDAVQNIEGGAKYLKQQLDRFGGDVSKALAAYNAGPGAVQKYNGIPPYAETQNYVKNVTAFANEYRQQAGTAATTATATTAASAALSASPLVTAALGVQTPTVPAAPASTGMNYSTT
jgi:soluble lytic murein transglycosylase-like protein